MIFNKYSWINLFDEHYLNKMSQEDIAHDALHIKRVIQLALKLADLENAKIEVILPAAYFHDFINVPKNDPRRSQASLLSADAAIKFLQKHDYPKQYFPEIHHAILTHSFSANLQPETIEAKIVQDADRLDGIGAIGVARCFATAARFKTSFYEFGSPFNSTLKRQFDDQQFAVDHFFTKLMKVAKSMKTLSGQKEAEKRLKFMNLFLHQLSAEIIFDFNDEKYCGEDI